MKLTKKEKAHLIKLCVNDLLQKDENGFYKAVFDKSITKRNLKLIKKLNK